MPALIRTRSGNETSPSLSIDVTGKDKHAYIIAGVMIGLVAFLVIGLWLATKGRAWYRRHQELKGLKKKAIANQQAWYRSNRPVHPKPTPITEVNRMQHNLLASTLPLYKGPVLDKVKIIGDQQSRTQHGPGAAVSPCGQLPCTEDIEPFLHSTPIIDQAWNFTPILCIAWSCDPFDATARATKLRTRVGHYNRLVWQSLSRSSVPSVRRAFTIVQRPRPRQ